MVTVYSVDLLRQTSILQCATVEVNFGFTVCNCRDILKVYSVQLQRQTEGLKCEEIGFGFTVIKS